MVVEHNLTLTLRTDHQLVGWCWTCHWARILNAKGKKYLHQHAALSHTPPCNTCREWMAGLRSPRDVIAELKAEVERWKARDAATDNDRKEYKALYENMCQENMQLKTRLDRAEEKLDQIKRFIDGN